MTDDGPVRLTRRGRVVLVVFAVGLLLPALWAMGGRYGAAGAAQPGSGVRATGFASVIAGDHDTLWAIAVRTRPGVDPRITVQRLIDINGLDGGAVIQPGQRIILPSR